MPFLSIVGSSTKELPKIFKQVLLQKSASIVSPTCQITVAKTRPITRGKRWRFKFFIISFLFRKNDILSFIVVDQEVNRPGVVVDEDVNLPGVVVDQEVNRPGVVVDQEVNRPGVVVDEDVNRPEERRPRRSLWLTRRSTVLRLWLTGRSTVRGLWLTGTSTFRA